MKKTSRIELFVNIKTTIISFISITMFVFLGMGVYLGMSWSGMSLKESLDVAFKQSEVHDIETSYIYGISEEEANEFLEYDDVDTVEVSFKAYEKFKYNDKEYQATISSYTNSLNKATILEGHYPTRDDEILIEVGSADILGIKVGDTVSFYGGNGTTNYLLSIIRNYESSKFDTIADKLSKECDNLKCDTFKIVGIISHPEYFSKSKASFGVNQQGTPIDALFYCDYSAFNEEATGNTYNTLFLKSDSLNEILSYKDEFKNRNKEIKDLISEQAKKLNDDAYKRIKGNLDQILADARAKIDDGQQQIYQGEIDLRNAINLIQTNEKKLADSEVELSNAKVKLDDGLNQLNAAEAQIIDGQRQIDENEAKLNSAKAVFETEKNKITTFFDDLDTTILALTTEVDPPLTNAQKYDLLIQIIDDFSEGQSITDFEKTLSDNNITLSDELQTEIDDIGDEVASLAIDFSIDVFDDLMTVYSDESTYEGKLVKEVVDISTDLQNGVITKEEAKAKYDADYEYPAGTSTGQSVYDAAWDLITDSPSEAIVDTAVSYGPRMLALSANTRITANKCIAEVQAYINDGESQLANAKTQIADARVKLQEGKKLYDDNKKLYESGLQQVADGKNKLAQAKVEVENGKRKLEDAKVQLEEAKEDYEEFSEKSESIKNYDVNVLTRNENAVVPFISLIANIISKLKYSLGGLFMIISIMVCYSVVTRNVNNQIKELGTKKALGFFDREITLSCLAYSLMSVVVGAILSIPLAIAIEMFVAPCVKNSFNFTIYPTYYNTVEFLILFAIEFTLILGITYIGCRNILKQNAIKLLQGKQPPETKNRFFEKYFIWKKLSLINKTIINNCLSDVMRVIATIVGVAGCAALIVSSITLKDNVGQSFRAQYVDYFMFDSFVYFDKDNETCRNELEAYFDEHNITYANVYRTLIAQEINGNSKTYGFTMAFEDNESFRDLVKFETISGEYDYKGLLIPESYQKYYGLNSGDEVKLYTINGDSYTSPITNYQKYYSYQLQVFMDSETYSEVFEEEYKPNMYIIDTTGNDFEQIYSDLNKIDGFTSMLDYYNYCKQDCDLFEMMSTVMVSIYLVVSTLMAIFILLNLYETFIDEKKRELIVLMINGYSVKQANKYIYSDAIFLTIIGLIIGVAIGIFAGDLSVGCFEGESLYLMHKIDWTACAIGVGVTSTLSFIMCAIALRRIKRFKLTDINKV